MTATLDAMKAAQTYAHASRDRRRTYRLGGAAAVRRGDWVFGAVSRCAESHQVCESEPGQLI
jgi:hypothetical protein